MKVGLYSVTYLGIWYRGGALAPMEFLRRAQALGYDGVELDGKRPHGNPIDLDERRRKAIRELAGELGLEIAAVASNNDLSSPVTEHRECQLLMLREQIRLARDLGAPVVRVFLAWPGVIMRDGLATYDVARQRWEQLWRDTTWLEAWSYCREALREAVRYAEEDGIVLALQNHAPVLRHQRDMLDMIAEVDSPWLRACLDAPLLTSHDDVFVREAVLQTGGLQVHTHFGGEFQRLPDKQVVQRPYQYGRPLTNYRAFVCALHEIGYNGYLCYELCHPVLDARHEPAGIDYVDEQAQLALEYMRKLLIEVEGVTQLPLPDDQERRAAAALA